MTTASLFSHCEQICAAFGNDLKEGFVFAKLLTTNDDAGRHGVLVPTEAYDFFPPMQIEDVSENQTLEFPAYDALSRAAVVLAFKYYQRYPERRITRLNSVFNQTAHGQLLAVFLKARGRDGALSYYVDCITPTEERYQSTLALVFGVQAEIRPGLFVFRALDSPAFSYDEPLTDFVQLFDQVSKMGWIESLRTGDTGIGYTFETLVGIKENNNQEADYKGIEVKCKQKKAGHATGGKINLFQKGPTWRDKRTAKQRIQHIGYLTEENLYACHSQLTTSPNNLDLRLAVSDAECRIDLKRSTEILGDWSYTALEKSLLKKHSRAVFVKADVRKSGSATHFRYEELIYCERPSIRNFLALLESRQLVFEFIMSQKENGTVRNHGYPWRLNREELLKDLFAMKIQLR